MQVQYLTNETYEFWDEFCYKHSYSTFKHTTLSLKYYINSSFTINSNQKSFMIINNNEIIAIQPVFLEKANNEYTLGIGGTPLSTPLILESLSKKTKNKIYKLILSELEKIVKEYSIKKIEYETSYLNEKYILDPFKYNIFLKYGFDSIDHLTNIIVLKEDIKKIYSNFSKGHKALLKNNESIQLKIYNYKNISKEKIDYFKNYYFKVAGKITRPDNTFNLIYEWIKNNNAILIEATDKTNNYICGYSLYIHYKNTAYYAMACREKNINYKNISHLIMYEAIKYYKQKNIVYLETGRQYYTPNTFEKPTKKDIDISTFKRGFGGYNFPVYHSIKFYDLEEKKKFYCGEGE